MCTHPERAAIDEALVTGVTNRVVSRQFRVGDDSVQRHRTHVREMLAVAQEAAAVAQAVEEVAQADDLLADIRDLRADLKAARKDALDAGKFAPAALLANAEMRAFELLTKIYAELNARNSADTLSDPRWREMRERVVEAFRDDAPALAKLLAAIEEGAAND